MAAYEKALDWRELFAIGIQEGVMGEKLIEMARGVAGTWQHPRDPRRSDDSS